MVLKIEPEAKSDLPIVPSFYPFFTSFLPFNPGFRPFSQTELASVPYSTDQTSQSDSVFKT